MRVVIFEARDQIGPGLAYQDDVETALLNRNAETMSVSASDYSTFSAWLRWKAHHEDALKSVSSADLTSAYVPRPTFGRFLSDFFLESCAAAVKKGLEIQIIPRAADAIRRGERYQIRHGDQILHADSVLLAVGNTGSRDHYLLGGHARFIASPYPLMRQIVPLRTADSICIIGSGLTAVDIAVTLGAQGYHGKIDIVSHSGHLPFVRGRQGPPHQLRHLTPAALTHLSIGGTRKASLRCVFRLFRAELRAVGCCWRVLLGNHATPVERLREELAEAGQVRLWQRVLAATNDVIEQAWHMLPSSDQQLVMKRYARAWLARRAPMPLGHITSGTYFFVSSLEMIARRAQHIAGRVLSSLAPHHKALAARPVRAPALD